MTAEAGHTEEGLGRRAVLDSAALGISLGMSWTLAFAGQIALRRVLGSERFGVLTFVESITLLVISLLAFGVDTYIRREVSIRPAHAVEIARPLSLVRWGAAVALSAGMGLVFFLTTRQLERALLASAFSLAMAAVIMGQTSAAYLHAIRAVKGVSQSAVATKVLWLLLVALVLAGPFPLFAAPLALFFSEGLRNIWLRADFRRHLGRPQPGSPRVALGVIRASTPYYVDSINLAFTSYAIPAMLGLLASDAEAGYFSTARQVMSVPMFFVPLLSWVLTPVLSRIRLRGSGMLWDRVHGIIAATIVPIFAGSLLLIPLVGLAVPVLFGEGFRPAEAAVAMLVPGLACTFLAVVLASALIADGKAWTVTRVNLVTVIGMIVTAAVPMQLSAAGPSGRAALWGAAVLGVWESITVVLLWRAARLDGLSGSIAIGLALSAVAGTVLMLDALGASLPNAALGAAVLVLVGVVGVTLPILVRQIRLLFTSTRSETDPDDAAGAADE